MFEKDEFVDLETFKVANILACLPQHIRQPLVTSLQQHRPNIGYLSMRFEDLQQADDQSIKALIASVGYQDLVLAMSTADEDLITKLCDNMSEKQARGFVKDIAKHHQTDSPDTFFNAFDAKINVITSAAKLRQNGQMSVPTVQSMSETIPQSMVDEIKTELQNACEKAMAEVLACYLPEAAAAVLCQRLDREKILEKMLQLDRDDDFCDVLADEEIEQLLCGITDEDVF